MNEGDSNSGLKSKSPISDSVYLLPWKWWKNGSMQICFQMIQSPRLFINRFNWILRKGLRGEKDFCTLKYSFEITPFDSGVKDRLIDKMINRQHDKWNFNESVSFICYHVVLLFCFDVSLYQLLIVVETCCFYVTGHASRDTAASHS